LRQFKQVRGQDKAVFPHCSQETFTENTGNPGDTLPEATFRELTRARLPNKVSPRTARIFLELSQW